jgi:hypothetical protein
MYIDNFFDLIKVYDTPYTKVRIGRNNDGGYVVPLELFEKIEGLYSIGIGDDFSFEIEAYERHNKQIIAVDPSFKIELEDHLYVLNRTIGKDITIQQLRRQHPIQGNKMLKFDIEGDEWDAIGYHSDYDIIVCELHLFTVEPKQYFTDYFKGLQKNFASKVNETLFEKYYSFLSALLNNYAIFHVHGNNSIPKTEMCGYSFPPLLEMTLINKKFMDNWRLSTETFPTEIDQPNKTDRPDFEYILPFKK